MITKIGIIAGEIWDILEKGGSKSLLDIMVKIDEPKEVVLMSLGWLAREGHVSLDKQTDNYIVNLR